jgi:hypothetical protein
MVRCDLGRAIVYALVPLGWWLAGPQLWLIYAVALAGIWSIAAFGGSTRGIVTMTLRQELTPDHLLGRVTAAFWTVFSVPGPLGALALTAFGERIGARTALLVVGLFILGVAAIAFFTPVRAFAPAMEGDRGVGQG